MTDMEAFQEMPQQGGPREGICLPPQVLS